MNTALVISLLAVAISLGVVFMAVNAKKKSGGGTDAG
jgi:hypothetical protein